MSEKEQKNDECNHARSRSLIHRLGSLSLLERIIIWVFLAVIAFVLVLVMLTIGGGSNILAGDAQPLNKTATALTIIGGIGAVGYLVIKYQERAAAEREEQRQVAKQEINDILTAVRLLGDDKPSTRIAGVQYLVRAGQSWPYTRQQIIDILCGYLRTTRKDDGPVELTILKAIRDHLTQFSNDTAASFHQSSYWENIDLDLHGSNICEQLDFEGITCNKLNLSYADLPENGITSFDHSTINIATFKGMSGKCATSFRSAHFSGPVDFSDMNLSDADFTKSIIVEATFEESILRKAKFCETNLANTNFTYARLKNADFTHANLSNANFSHVTLQNADFSHSTLADVNMIMATLQSVNFEQTNMENVDCFGSIFTDVQLPLATLNGVNFSSADLTGIDDFSVVSEPIDVLYEKQRIHDIKELQLLVKKR